MTIYTEQDLYNYVVPKPCTKRVPILLFVTRAGVLGRLGTGIGSITTSTQFYYKLSQELNGDMEWVANSLVTLQNQLNFLAAVVLQNQRALDLLTAEMGGTCLFLGEECCYYVNQSRIVTEKVKEIRDRIQRRAEELQNTSPWDLLSQWMAWILPFLGPLATIILLLLFGSCIFNLLVKFVSSRIEAIKLQMVLQMEPQMQSITKIYRGPLDQPASPCSNVDDIEGNPRLLWGKSGDFLKESALVEGLSTWLIPTQFEFGILLFFMKHSLKSPHLQSEF
nr:syncytin-1-like [Symphalangus syndactylus]